MILHCLQCSGEGRIFKSKYGGNDPDVWDAGKCEACDGSGNATCDNRGFDEDGNALCQECLMESAMGEFGPNG